MNDLPVIVIGAGPIGLAAAAHLNRRDVDFLVVESGERAGAAVREWGHIRLFSQWSELTDPVAADLLHAVGWSAPVAATYPTGTQWAELYLQPLADALGERVRYRHHVSAVTRQGRDLMIDSGRGDAAFVVHADTPMGRRRLAGRAVIDASGTWRRPNPLGTEGVPADGEAAVADRISYRVPDLRDPDVRSRYAGKHVVVAGTGASAQTALIGLADLDGAGTTVSWLVRRASAGAAFGGGDNDQLVARGELGKRAHAAVAAGRVRTYSEFRTIAVRPGADGRLRVESADGQFVEAVDEVVAVTGFRPDLSFLSEVRLDLDAALQAPRDLAPLIDPNVHSCGTVSPHGAKELAQPERGFYLAGMKSYGRAPSFLALTGYEQVRSVVAELAGDHDAASRVELTLPESGVCGGSGVFDEPETGSAGDGCCGPAVATPQPISIGSRPPA